MLKDFYEKLISGEKTLAVVGLGYVGLPIAVEFSKKIRVIGFDLNCEKVAVLNSGVDPTGEIGDEALKESPAKFTCDANELAKADFYIVAVPTPVNADKTPDLAPLSSASKIVGDKMKPGSVVVFESTVYPGVTQEICMPLLEAHSGLKCGRDFKIGYSPERINPGDKEHRLETVVKVVSGMDDETLELVAKVYSLVVKAGVFRAKSIKVAEAAKVIENSQRDINIAFMNELSIIFDKLGIDTKSVLEAAGTKWNFMQFSPGLVGGHCIGIDPYYLTYKVEQLGYHSQVILAGRQINDEMGRYVAGTLVKKLVKVKTPIIGARIAVLGFTFKNDCRDTRNTKVIDICTELSEYGADCFVVDPVAQPEQVLADYGIKLYDISELSDMDAVIISVNHREFLSLTQEKISLLFKDIPPEKRVLLDLKGILNMDEFTEKGYVYWRL